jgi:RNA 2',3'-cyclic 3'-phosphodiesterase
VRTRLAEEIARLRGLSRSVAWTVPENLHITLKFLGPIELTQRALVATALARLAGGVPAFDITLRGLGAFPSLTRPRVIWGGVDDGAHALTSLADAVEQVLTPLGFTAEERFVPHVTLGRVRQPRRDPVLTEALALAATRDFGAVHVDRIALMRSALSPRGARHDELATWKLRSDGG